MSAKINRRRFMRNSGFAATGMLLTGKISLFASPTFDIIIKNARGGHLPPHYLFGAGGSEGDWMGGLKCQQLSTLKDDIRHSRQVVKSSFKWKTIHLNNIMNNGFTIGGL